MTQLHELENVRAVIFPEGEEPYADRLLVDRIKVPGGWIVVVTLLLPIPGARGYANTTSQFVADPEHKWFDAQCAADSRGA